MLQTDFINSYTPTLTKANPSDNKRIGKNEPEKDSIKREFYNGNLLRMYSKIFYIPWNLMGISQVSYRLQGMRRFLEVIPLICKTYDQ